MACSRPTGTTQPSVPFLGRCGTIVEETASLGLPGSLERGLTSSSTWGEQTPQLHLGLQRLQSWDTLVSLTCQPDTD